MKKIRIGNDFRFVWVIERNSQAEDLTLATNLVLTIKSMYGDSAIPFTIVDGNKVCVDVDSKNAGNVAKYNLRLAYTIPDDSLSDGFRDCSVDIDAFEIVAKTELAEKVDEFTSTSEIAIGFQGNSAFRVWQLQNGNEDKTYEDYIAFLRQPAIEAALLANEKAALVDSAATLANTKAGLANDAAVLATDKAGLADSKATLANEKAALAQSAADNANTKATEFTAAEGLRVTAETGRVTAETGRATAETGRTTAESARVSAETTRGANEMGRQTAETARIGAESSRATAETGRATAETARVAAENARNVASNVYNVTVSVPLSAGQYYTLATAVAAVVVGLRKKGLTITFESAAGVWETYQFTGASTATWTTTAQWVKDTNYPNVTELLELPIAEVLNVLYAKIQALEAFIKTSQYGNVTADQVDVVRNFNIWGKTNLILDAPAAPAVVPDFVGQTFINTAAGVTYTAKGISSVADWKQTSN